MNKKLQVLKNQQDDIFTQMAHILGILAAPVRIKLIHFLSQAPLTVEVLADKINQSVANTSMHLRKMLNDNIVSVETVGQKRLYSLHPAVFDFWERCQDFIQKLDPSLSLTSEELYGDLNWKLPIDKTFEMARNRELVFLDVRPLDEVVHIPLSLKDCYIHIATNDLPDKLNLLPKKKKILVLCRGRMCALSVYTVNYLRENNFKAYRLEKSSFAINQILSNEDYV